MIGGLGRHGRRRSRSRAPAWTSPAPSSTRALVSRCRPTRCSPSWGRASRSARASLHPTAPRSCRWISRASDDEDRRNRAPGRRAPRRPSLRRAALGLAAEDDVDFALGVAEDLGAALRADRGCAPEPRGCRSASPRRRCSRRCSRRARRGARRRPLHVDLARVELLAARRGGKRVIAREGLLADSAERRDEVARDLRWGRVGDEDGLRSRRRPRSSSGWRAGCPRR